MANNYKKALEKSIEYFNGDSLAAEVFLGKYALKSPDGEILEETPRDMHKRLAKELARIEAKYPNPLSEEEIFELLDGFKYIVPQGSPMAGIGNKSQILSLSNCYVVDSPADSFSGIMYTDTQLANLMKRRAGVGLDISKLRPLGTKVKNASGSTTGIGSFMERYSNTTREVGQCIARGERVLTKRGFIEIESVIPNDDFVWTKTGWVKVLEIKSNGQRELFKTTTNYGFSIRTTLNHVFLNENGLEQKLEDFEAGDDICLLEGKPNIELQEVALMPPTLNETWGTRTVYNYRIPSRLTEELAYLIGYSYGDGSVEYNKVGQAQILSLACSNDWSEIKQQLSTAAVNQFQYMISPRPGDGKLEKFDIRSNVIVQFLKDNDLLKQKSKDIIIPRHIWNSPSKVQSAFISGYFDADGYASGRKKGYAFASISLSFLKDIQVLLLSNGVISKIHTEDRAEKGWNTLYTLCVVGKSAQENLVKLLTQSVKVQKSGFVAKRDCYNTPYNRKSLNDTKLEHYNYLSPQNISLGAYRRYRKDSERFDLPEHALIKASIRSIEQDGIDETYDLVLESEHMFWCEGFYVHNSGRRGALLISVSVHHPEIETFINIKKDRTKVTGANISIRFTDEFMNAVKNDEEYEQRWPVDSEKPTIVKMVRAKQIWDQFTQAAWDSAEPGALFWDTVTKNSPADIYEKFGFKTISTNPCGEVPLSFGDSCRLLLVNLASYVEDPFSKNSAIDYDLFAKHVVIAQRLMDDIVDLELECIDKIITKIDQDPESPAIKSIELEMWKIIKQNCENGRRTGLGITGLGDALAFCNIKYGTEQAIKETEKIYQTLALNAYRSSVIMAKERGAFQVFDYELENGHVFLNRIMDLDPGLKKDWKTYGRRNIACLTTAPAGSVSILTQTTSGIEPVFLTHYKRRKKINPNDQESRVDFIDPMGDKWQEYVVYHHGFKKWMEAKNKTENDFNESPYFGATSNDVDWSNSVQLQSVAQKWIDHSISKTCNLPADVSKDLVGQIYMEAWKAGCKGFTVYRDGCRSGVLVSDTSKKAELKFEEHHAPKRPKELDCEIYHFTAKGEKWNAFVGMYEGRPYEIFAGRANFVNIPRSKKHGKIVKNGKFNLLIGDGEDQIVVNDLSTVFENTTESAFTRTLSLALRHGTPIQYVVEQIEKGASKDNDMSSLAKGLMRVLKSYIKDGTKVSSVKKCDSCGESSGLIYQEGCLTCKGCGWSKCN